MPRVEIANMPPNSHDVGFCGPSTAMNPTEPASITTGNKRASTPAGTIRSGSGGGSRVSSPPGMRGGVRRGRGTPTVLTVVPPSVCPLAEIPENGPPAARAWRY